MNDEIEPLKVNRQRATQPGCRHWTPIFPLSVDEKEGAKERVVMPDPGEDPKNSPEQKPN